MISPAAIGLLVFALVMVLAREHRPESRRAHPKTRPQGPPIWTALLPGGCRALGVLAVALSVFVVGALAAVILATGGLGAWIGFRQRGVRARHRAVDRATPDLVNLFVLAASVGHPVHRSLELVAPRAPLAVRPILTAACRRVARGAPLAPVLGDVGRELGPLGTTLTNALVVGLVTGAPLTPALAGVAEVARDHRRRQAEEAAKRLPVTLLLPLVCCVLPAFTLLAVVPLVAGSFASLRV